MFIDSFRKTGTYHWILLVLFVLFLRLPVFFNASVYEHLPLYQPFVNLRVFFQTDFFADRQFNLLLTALAILSQAVIFGRIIAKYNFFNKFTYMPELMFVVLCSIHVSFLSFSPVVLCNFFLLWLLDKTLALYRTQVILSGVFDMGLIVALGSIIYPPFLLLFPVVLYSLSVFRPFSWREWFTGIIGLIIPYLFLATFYFWKGDLAGFQQYWLSVSLRLPHKLLIDKGDYLALGPIIIVSLLALNQVRVMFYKNVVLVRKSLQCLGGFLFVILLIYFLLPDPFLNHLMLGAAPMATFMAFYFISAKRRWFYESAFAFLLGSIFYFQFFS